MRREEPSRVGVWPSASVPPRPRNRLPGHYATAPGRGRPPSCYQRVLDAVDLCAEFFPSPESSPTIRARPWPPGGGSATEALAKPTANGAMLVVVDGPG
jgi:hypothetical protein